jgi:hypothetical protein
MHVKKEEGRRKFLAILWSLCLSLKNPWAMESFFGVKKREEVF